MPWKHTESQTAVTVSPKHTTGCYLKPVGWCWMVLDGVGWPYKRAGEGFKHFPAVSFLGQLAVTERLAGKA